MNRRLLRIYLNDHLAVMAAVGALAQRSSRSNAGSPLGTWLAGFTDDQADAQQALERAMRRLRVRKARWKVAAARLGQRAGQLKLNGRLRSYSPLSRVLELESLVAGVEWNLAVLGTLNDLADPRLEELHLDARIQRSREHTAALERFRAEAASAAFGDR
jgi:hypothetical protein